MTTHSIQDFQGRKGLLYTELVFLSLLNKLYNRMLHLVVVYTQPINDVLALALFLLLFLMIILLKEAFNQLEKWICWAN